MPAPPITRDLDRFLFAFVHTYEQLESLVLLNRDPTRDWSADEVAAAIDVENDRVQMALGQLAAAGIVDASRPPGTAGTRYRGPRAMFRDLVDALSYAFEHDKIHVIAAMNHNALERVRTDALRAFADAFMIRRRDG